MKDAKILELRTGVKPGAIPVALSDAFLETLIEETEEALEIEFSAEDVELTIRNPDEKEIGALLHFEFRCYYVAEICREFLEHTHRDLASQEMHTMATRIGDKNIGITDIFDPNAYGGLVTDELRAQLMRATLTHNTLRSFYELSVRRRTNLWNCGIAVRRGPVAVSWRR